MILVQGIYIISMQQNRESRNKYLWTYGSMTMSRIVFQVTGERMAYRINNSRQHVTLCKKKKKEKKLARPVWFSG